MLFLSKPYRSNLLPLIGGLCLVASGCQSTRDASQRGNEAEPGSDSLTERTELVTDAVFGTVRRVVNESRFVVVDFSLRSRPQIGQELNVYREGFKVAEISITGPFRSTHVAADIKVGQVRVGDIVRSE